jgi:hypothetical protein
MVGQDDKKEMDEEESSEVVPDPASAAPAPKDEGRQGDSGDDDSVSSEEDDDLVLEGVLVRNPDAPSSSSDDDGSDDDDDDEEEEEEEEESVKKMPAKEQKSNGKTSKNNTKNDKKRPALAAKTSNNKKQSKVQKKNKNRNEPELIMVDFTFHDMEEKFFHGLKNLLHGQSTVYQPHSSALTDLMLENVSVGTVCSTQGDVDGDVYGFASVLNVATYQDKPCIQYLKKLCLDNCPADRKQEMETVLSGKTARPAGFFFQGRMINLPLEIVEALHKQLVLDMDWAVENAEGGEAERKSLNFGAFVRLAPASMDGGALVYRFFDDEISATNAEFVYNINAPPSYGSEEKQMVSIIVMTKTGHRQAMKELKQLVGSGGA